MRIPDFALERYFARWEFACAHNLCASDVEGVLLDELLALADDETRALWRGLGLGYVEPRGHPLLRRAIAEQYERVSPDDVVVFSGAEEAIFAFVNSAVGAGDHAVVIWPCYQSLHEVARAAGAEVTLLPLHEIDGWALDLDRLRRAVRPETRLVVINFPNNPTGATLDAATLDAVLALAEEAGALVLSDEVYRLLEIDGAPLPAAVDRSPGATSVSVMSKVFGLAGLRVGWLACRSPEVLARAAAYKDYLSICASAPSEVLSIIALRASRALLARSRGIIAANLPELDRFFRDWADVFAWTRPRGGSVCFPRLLGTERSDDFARDLVEAEGVLLLPGSVYGEAGAHFRVGFGRTDFRRALEGLERFSARRFRGDRR